MKSRETALSTARWEPLEGVAEVAGESPGFGRVVFRDQFMYAQSERVLTWAMSRERRYGAVDCAVRAAGRGGGGCR